MEKLKKKSFPVRYLLIVAAVIAVIIILLIVFSHGSSNISKLQIDNGVAFIKNEEEQDVSDIEKAIFAASKEKLLAEIDDKLEEDPEYVWTALDQINTVIMGDSRAVAFSSYGFMDESKVLADGGQSLKIITSHYEELQVANPNLIVLAYGLNDINWYWFSPEEFAEEMMGYVDEIQAMLPDAYIYIQSILPANAEGELQYPNAYPYAREWNEAEMEIYKANGYRVMEISWLVDEYPEYYGDDGVHFYPGFYYYWADAILKTYLADTMEVDD